MNELLGALAIVAGACLAFVMITTMIILSFRWMDWLDAHLPGRRPW